MLDSSRIHVLPISSTLEVKRRVAASGGRRQDIQTPSVLELMSPHAAVKLRGLIPLFHRTMEASFSPPTNASTNQDWSSYRYRTLQEPNCNCEAKRKRGARAIYALKPPKAYYSRFDLEGPSFPLPTLSSSIDVANKADWSNALFMGIIFQRAVSEMLTKINRSDSLPIVQFPIPLCVSTILRAPENQYCKSRPENLPK